MTDVVVTSARVDAKHGTAATIDLVEVGGGTQTVTVDGTPEERTHPASRVYHVRLLSPDRMIPDQLRVVATFDDAVKLAQTYAGKLDKHAGRVAAIAEDLQV